MQSFRVEQNQRLAPCREACGSVRPGTTPAVGFRRRSLLRRDDSGAGASVFLPRYCVQMPLQPSGRPLFCVQCPSIVWTAIVLRAMPLHPSGRPLFCVQCLSIRPDDHCSVCNAPSIVWTAIVLRAMPLQSSGRPLFCVQCLFNHPDGHCSAGNASSTIRTAFVLRAMLLRLPRKRLFFTAGATFAARSMTWNVESGKTTEPYSTSGFAIKSVFPSA